MEKYRPAIVNVAHGITSSSLATILNGSQWQVLNGLPSAAITGL